MNTVRRDTQTIFVTMFLISKFFHSQKWTEIRLLQTRTFSMRCAGPPRSIRKVEPVVQIHTLDLKLCPGVISATLIQQDLCTSCSSYGSPA